MNVVDISSLTRSFGRATALDGVSFSVPESTICGLLGRNGAGKTTIMSMIAGQDRPTSGTIAVFGERPFENESVLSRISFVRDNQRYPDNYRLHHVLRIAPDFAPNWDAAIADELVDVLRIPAKVAIKKFSRGQLSSVAILLGLASRAPLTLLDEPYLGLDVTARALFHDILIRDYAKHPRTVILSTHLIDESEALFDRVLIVDRGRIRVDSEIEHTGDLAFIVSGSREAVDRLASDRKVFQSHSIAGLKSATIEGQFDEETASEAKRLGAQIRPVSLQELVSAFGADSTELSKSKEGSRA